MKMMRVIATALAAMLICATAALAGPGGPPWERGRGPKVKIHAPGEAFCPASRLVYGGVLIQPGRCYMVYVLRDGRGTFLAFTFAGVRIPPGQIVRMGTPAGAKVRKGVIYLIPLRTTAVIVPMNTVMLVGIRAEDSGSAMSLTIVGTQAPSLTVVFNVRF